jgi:hypothetical protein
VAGGPGALALPAATAALAAAQTVRGSGASLSMP